MDTEQRKVIQKMESLYEEMKAYKDMERAHLAKLIRKELEPLMHSIRDLKQDILNLHFQDRLSFTLNEAAQLTGFSYHTLYHWGRTGRLRVSQPAGEKGATIVSRETLIQLIIDHQVPINPYRNKRDVGTSP